MNRVLYGILFLGIASLVPAAAPSASSSYDGRWSVSILTEKGDCDAYRYDIEVAGGTLRLVNTDAVELSGTVAGNGSVTVNVQRGEQRANGKGRLARTNGRGVWHGVAPSGACSGSWTAERR
jgi:hypothetical protein